jgi:MFS family permease
MNFKALKEEFALLWRFYIFFFLYGIMGAITAPYMLFYLAAGLNFTQIGLILGISMFVAVISEIPTGAIADVFGRKISVGISFLLMGITWIMIPLFPRFVPLLIIVSIANLVSTLRTGADEAWVIDYLKQNKKGSMTHLFFMHKVVVANIGLVLGGILSTIIVLLFGLPAIWIVGGAFAIAIAVYIFFVGREKFRRIKQVTIAESIGRTFKMSMDGINYIRHHLVLRVYIIGAFFLMFAGAIFGMLWPPLLAEVGLHPSNIGLIVSASGFICMAAPLLSKRYAELFKNDKRAIITAYILLLIGVALLAFINAPWQGILIILGMWVITDVMVPLESKFYHSFIKSKYRATVVSIIAMVCSVSGAIVYISNGFVSDMFGIRTAILVFCILASISIPFLAMMKPEGQKTHI